MTHNTSFVGFEIVSIVTGQNEIVAYLAVPDSGTLHWHWQCKIWRLGEGRAGKLDRTRSSSGVQCRRLRGFDRPNKGFGRGFVEAEVIASLNHFLDPAFQQETFIYDAYSLFWMKSMICVDF